MNVYCKVFCSVVIWLCVVLLVVFGYVWVEDWWVVYKGDDFVEFDVFLVDVDLLVLVLGIENVWQVQIVMLFDFFYLFSVYQYCCDM